MVNLENLPDEELKQLQEEFERVYSERNAKSKVLKEQKEVVANSAIKLKNSM